MLDVVVAIEGFAGSPLVAAYRYRDGLSTLFELELELLFEDAALDFEPLIGAELSARFQHEAFLPAVRGVIAEIEQKSFDAKGRSHYLVRVVPPLALLRHRAGHRIVQHEGLCAIAVAVMKSAGHEPTLKITDDAAREYTVQYGETDLGFAQRLLAEAGVGFYFDHHSGSEPVLFDDLSASASPRAGAPYRPEEGRVEGRPHVHFAHASARVRPGRVALRDYDYQRPDLELAAELGADRARTRELALEQYEVEIGDPANAGDPKKLAKRILEELRARASTTRLLTSFALPAGSELVLEDAPRPDLVAPLVVLACDTHVTQSHDGAHVLSTLTVAPKSVPHRPERLPKPRIWGSQTAVVVGEEGEEIDVDDQGRVCVAFHWDRRGIRSGAPTRRVRVSQAWAGPGYGLMTIPRIGDEVVVTYLDGDPDEPLIVGRVHNRVAPPPLSLPQEKTRSIWKSRSTPNAEGANHIVLEDLAGKELLELHAQLDMNEHVNRHATRSVGENAKDSVFGNSEDYVKGYHSQRVQGSETIQVDGMQNVGIGLSQNVTIGASQSITVATSQTLKSAMLGIKSGPIGVQGTGIVVNGSQSIDAKAPNVALEGGALLSGKAPTVTFEGGGQATMRAPVAAVVADGVATVASAGAAIVNAMTISIAAGSTVEVGADGAITIAAPKVIVSGSGLVQVSGGTVNVSADGNVNVTGGIVAIN